MWEANLSGSASMHQTHKIISDYKKGSLYFIDMMSITYTIESLHFY